MFVPRSPSSLLIAVPTDKRSHLGAAKLAVEPQEPKAAQFKYLVPVAMALAVRPVGHFLL